MKEQQRKDNLVPPPEKLREFRTSVLIWFENNGRKFPWRLRSNNKYRYIIAEVLLQRTRAETIADFFPEFVKQYPSWRSLNLAPIEDLHHFLRPIGLWKRRASSLKALSSEMVKRKGRFPRIREELEELPGVGQYIANAVLLFCHGEPQPLLDGNMARVLERVFGVRVMADIRYDPYLQQLASEIVKCITPREVNWAILDLAATICLQKKPDCERCPAMNICAYFFERK